MINVTEEIKLVVRVIGKDTSSKTVTFLLKDQKWKDTSKRIKNIKISKTETQKRLSVNKEQKADPRDSRLGAKKKVD